MAVANTLFGLFIIYVIGTGIAAPPKKIYHFPAEKSEVLIESLLKCVSKMGLDFSIVQSVKEGRYSDDEKVVEGLVCMNIDTGYGKHDGRINVDKVMTDLFSKKPEIRSPMESCDKEYGKTPTENLKQFLICFREKAPVKILL